MRPIARPALPRLLLATRIMHVCRADVYRRVSMVQWGFGKAVTSLLLLGRAALNLYSVANNVHELRRDDDMEYRVVRRIVFGFELAMVCFFLFVWLFRLLHGWWLRCLARRQRHNIADPVTGKPWNNAYITRRQQVCARVRVCCVVVVMRF